MVIWMSNLLPPRRLVTTVALQPKQHIMEIGTQQDAGARTALQGTDDDVVPDWRYDTMRRRRMAVEHLSSSLVFKFDRGSGFVYFFIWRP